LNLVQVHPVGRRVISRSVIRALAVAVALLLLIPAAASAVPAISGEFKVEGLGTNNKLVEGPDGNIWATIENGGKNVAKIAPDGTVTEYELGINNAQGIARGPEGNLWVTSLNALTSFSPANPVLTKNTTAIPTIATFYSIVAGPDGNLWVATENLVLRIPPKTPGTQQPFPVGELSPRDIDAAGPLLVVADGSGTKSRIVTLTTAGVEKDYPLITNGASQGVAGNAAGLIAYSQPGTAPEQVGLIQPPTASPPINLPGGGDPFGVVLGSDQAFWVVRTATNDLARLTTAGAVTFLPGLKNEARQITAGPNNTLWVSQTKAGEEAVVRVVGLEPPVSPPAPPPPPTTAPETKLDKGPKGRVTTRGKRATVKFRFSSTTAGASFECRLLHLGAKKAKASKAILFRACKSPKTYHLKPGRYRFEVRAVLSGVPDPTPAKRSFRVVHVQKH
jgi:streptogramin lyase